MNINLEYYKIFYYVAKHGSITKAARELCLSQPAVSQEIKQLEENLGVALFVRQAKGVSLTYEGQVLYSYVEKGYESIIQGEAKVKELIGLEIGEVKIGASDMTLQYFLLPYLEKYYSMYPEIRVNVTNAPTPSTIDHLLAGRIDFGVISTPFVSSENIKVYKGRKINDIFVAGEKYRELEGKILEYEDLMKYPLICLEKNTSTRRFVDDFLNKNNLQINPEFELATSAMVVQFATRNLGIGCVVEDFAKDELESGKIFKLQFKEELPNREICVITDKKNVMSRAANALLSFLEEEYETLQKP